MSAATPKKKASTKQPASARKPAAPPPVSQSATMLTYIFATLSILFAVLAYARYYQQ